MTDHFKKMLDKANEGAKKAAAGMRDAANRKRGESLTERDNYMSARLWGEAEILDAEAEKLDPSK